MKINGIVAADLTSKRGFTLVELCMVMVIMGLVLSGYLSFEMGRAERERMRVTKENISVIQNALMVFYNRNMRYPCPALVNIGSNVSDYARETNCTDEKSRLSTYRDGLHFLTPANEQSIDSTASSDHVGIGEYVPTRSLGIADRYGTDGWGRKISYIYSLSSSDRHGALMVMDAFGQSLIDPPASYILISSGPSGTGEYLSDGTINGCRIGTRDGKNCDGDIVFTREDVSQGDNETFFDDILVHDRDAVYADDDRLDRILESLLMCQRERAFFDPDDRASDSNGCVMSSFTSGNCADMTCLPI